MDGELRLRVYHAYYYQVQAQLKFCNAKYCYFVVFSEEELFIHSMYIDEPFITWEVQQVHKGLGPSRAFIQILLQGASIFWVVYLRDYRQ